MTGVVVVQNSTHTIQRVVHGQLARIHSHDVWAIVGAHTPCTLWALLRSIEDSKHESEKVRVVSEI